jgi:pantoate--beta-alanine ligase
VRQALGDCDTVIASIFVNPLQFGPREDLSRYPRPFERDVALLQAAGCQALFAPEASEIYLPDASTRVIESKVSGPLCGEQRPGHFEGVTTVVLKLFNLVQPHHAYFGQKDAQQCAVIERMVRDLDLPLQLHRGETIREFDGLALSSRNVYLNREERSKAPRIHQSLKKVLEAFRAGERDGLKLQKLGRSFLEQDPSFQVQYFELRESASLDQVAKAEAGTTVFVAALLGTTRLIDNETLTP